MKKIFVGFAAILMLSACSKSESTDAAKADKADNPSEGVTVEGKPAEGVQPSERPSAGDGTVKIKAGNTEVVVDKDGNKVTTGNVKVDKDGVTTGGVKVGKDGVTTGGVKVKKDGTTTVGGVKVGKDGTVTVPGY
jgi:flagellar hook assembly protein FlgD